MNCPDAATLAEVSALYEGDAHATLAHITTCAACRETLALCDQLAASAHLVEVPAALYVRLDAVITATAGATAAPTASRSVPATNKRSGWHTPILATVSLGVSLVLMAAMTPSTSSRPVDWPALIVLSVFGGAAFTLLERRAVR